MCCRRVGYNAVHYSFGVGATTGPASKARDMREQRVPPCATREAGATRGAAVACVSVEAQTARIQKHHGKGMPPPGIEPGTFCLQDRCSTTEPHRRNFYSIKHHFSPTQTHSNPSSKQSNNKTYSEQTKQRQHATKTRNYRD
jgi:hypothetical protein